MSPEGRNVDNSYSLSLEVAAVLDLAPSGEFLPSVLRISPLRPQIISAWLLINFIFFIFPLIFKITSIACFLPPNSPKQSTGEVQKTEHSKSF